MNLDKLSDPLTFPLASPFAQVCNMNPWNLENVMGRLPLTQLGHSQEEQPLWIWWFLVLFGSAIQWSNITFCNTYFVSMFCLNLWALELLSCLYFTTTGNFPKLLQLNFTISGSCAVMPNGRSTRSWKVLEAKRKPGFWSPAVSQTKPPALCVFCEQWEFWVCRQSK